MPIKYAAIVPHPPLLVPRIGKETISRIKQTESALIKVRQSLLNNDIQTIVIISSHGAHLKDLFTLSVSPEYTCNFEDFGDFSTKETWPSDPALTAAIIDDLSPGGKLNIVYKPELDYGSSVPLLLITKEAKDISVIPLSYAESGASEHYEFGQKLFETLENSRRRIAVIASGDLSHCLSKDSPGGYSPKGKKFDNKITELLKNNAVEDIIELDKEIVDGAMECGYRSILLLLGTLSGKKNKPQLISYEAPFGVGYLVMGFNFVC